MPDESDRPGRAGESGLVERQRATAAEACRLDDKVFWCGRRSSGCSCACRPGGVFFPLLA